MKSLRTAVRFRPSPPKILCPVRFRTLKDTRKGQFTLLVRCQSIFDGDAQVSTGKDSGVDHPDKAKMSLNVCKITSANDDMYEIKRAA